MLCLFEEEEFRGGNREPGGGRESLRPVRGLLLDASGESLRLLIDAVMTGSCHTSAQLWAMLGSEKWETKGLAENGDQFFFPRSVISPIGWTHAAADLGAAER